MFYASDAKQYMACRRYRCKNSKGNASLWKRCSLSYTTGRKLNPGSWIGASSFWNPVFTLSANWLVLTCYLLTYESYFLAVRWL